MMKVETAETVAFIKTAGSMSCWQSERMSIKYQNKRRHAFHPLCVWHNPLKHIKWTHTWLLGALCLVRQQNSRLKRASRKLPRSSPTLNRPYTLAVTQFRSPVPLSATGETPTVLTISPEKWDHKHIFVFYKICFIYFCVCSCVCGQLHAMEHMWRSEGTSRRQFSPTTWVPGLR